MSVKLRLPGNALEFEQEFVNEIERNTIYWSFFWRYLCDYNDLMLLHVRMSISVL